MAEQIQSGALVRVVLDPAQDEGKLTGKPHADSDKPGPTATK